MYIYIYIHIHILHIYIYIYICISLCIYIYIYICIYFYSLRYPSSPACVLPSLKVTKSINSEQGKTVYEIVSEIPSLTIVSSANAVTIANISLLPAPGGSPVQPDARPAYISCYDIYIYIYMYSSIRLYIYVCMYIYIYIYIYILIVIVVSIPVVVIVTEIRPPGWPVRATNAARPLLML